MRLSQLFVPTRKEGPHGEVSTNAQLLTRAGYLEKLMAGVYTLLPLGLMVLRRIEAIIRQELNAIGCWELSLPSLHPRSVWEETGRWSSLKPIMYQFKDRGGREVGLGATHEEIVTDFVRHAVRSYRDLPLLLYQIQRKFRDEPRAKSGLIRLREFVMKDLYSFHADQADLDACYDRVKGAYLTIFNRCGLRSLVSEASGGDFSQQHSHEFSVLTEAGEDWIVYCPSGHLAQNREIATVTAGQPCPAGDDRLVEGKAVEVGNIFKLGTRYSASMGATFIDRTGQRQPILMASYGIGLERVLATIVEVHHDDRGIRWPPSVAPASATLIALGTEARSAADRFYGTCQARKIPVLYADRDQSPGEQFALADLIGLPVRLVFSPKTRRRVEWQDRAGRPELVTPTAALKRLVTQNPTDA